MLSMFRRRHLNHVQWESYRWYWPLNKKLLLININPIVHQRVSSFIHNEHKRSNNRHNGYQNILRYQLIIISIIIQIFIKLPGLVDAGELRLNPNINRTIRHSGPDHSFFISCLPYSDDAKGISDSRFRAKELSWKKLRKVPIPQWVVFGSASGQRVYVEQSSDGRGLDLIFRSLEKSDEGEYACTATLDGRKEHRNVSLGIIEPISFSETPSVQSTQVGDKNKTMVCRVTGNPKPIISWRVRGNSLWPAKSKLNSSTEKKINNPDYSSINKKYYVTERGDLVIRNITREDKGNYKCKATQLENGFTDFSWRVIQLKVEHKPEWTSTREGKRSEFYGFISGTANLTCVVIAEPPADFTWYRVKTLSGTTQTIQTKKYSEYKNKEKITKELYPSAQIVNENGKSTLMLPMTHDTLFGEYRCQANNSMGSISREVHLLEGAKPGIPKLGIHEINSENASFIIKKNQAELVLDITGFQLELKEGRLTKWKDSTRKNIPTNPSGIYTLGQLRPQNVYLVRARSRNLAGLSEPSNIVYLQTNRTFKLLGRNKKPYKISDLTGSGNTIASLSTSHLMSFTTLCCLLVSSSIYMYHLALTGSVNRIEFS